MATKPSTGSLRPKTSVPVFGPASRIVVPPKRYSLLPPSTKPRPASNTCAVLPSPATLSICTSTIIGTICNMIAAALPSTRTSPLTALSGTTTCTSVPAALTALGRTITSSRLPLLSVV